MSHSHSNRNLPKIGGALDFLLQLGKIMLLDCRLRLYGMLNKMETLVELNSETELNMNMQYKERPRSLWPRRSHERPSLNERKLDKRPVLLLRGCD